MLEPAGRPRDGSQQELDVTKVTCPRCGTVVHAFPPELLEIAGDRSDSVDAELHIVTRLVRLRGDDGERFTVRDAVGALTCPACSQRIRFFRNGH
jgi:DNA-directed RNA polymerase subunit RPC12/RpoP